MKILFFLLLYIGTIFAQNSDICFYSNETYIKNFKTLKIDFYEYLKDYNGYGFQPFDDVNNFEEFISKKMLLLYCQAHILIN